MTQATASGEQAARTVARISTVDAFVAALITLFGAVVAYESYRLGAGWTSDGPGAGYFPFYIGLILAICGVVILVQALKARPSDDSSFVDNVQLRQVLSVLVPSVVYVAAIMLLGIYIASALFILLFMIILGKYSILKAVITGVGVNVLFFCMFEIWFKVPLYKGVLNPLSFMGY